VSGVCEFCAKPFTSSARTARFCTAKCRKGAFVARREAAELVDAPPVRAGTVVAVLAELTAAGRLGGHLGASALALAQQIDGATAVQNIAPATKELRLTMAAALAGVQSKGDALDELRNRRDSKRAG